jgi:hypothetical protein
MKGTFKMNECILTNSVVAGFIKYNRIVVRWW